MIGSTLVQSIVSRINALKALYAAANGATLFGWLQTGTGATQRTVASKLAEGLSAADWSVPTDGVTDASTSIQAADAAAAAAGKMLVLGPGSYLLTASITFASYVWMMPGAVIVSPGANAIQFVGGFDAPLVYCLNIAGYTNFQKTPQLYPQWFGAMGDAVYCAGSITTGTNTLTVTIPPPGMTGVSAFKNGDTIFVRGAGAAGAILATTVSSGAGTATLTLAANASTTVTNAECASRDNTTALQRWMAAFIGGGNVGAYGASLPGSTGCTKAYSPRGVYTSFGTINQYSACVWEGEYANTIGGAVFVQCNITQPLVTVIADNFNSAGATVNGGSGNNIWRGVVFKSATINDASANSPVVFFKNAWNTHSDSEFDHCLFQNTAGACIGAGFQTTGSITTGTNTLTLANGATLRNGNNAGGQVTVKGAGASGADLVTYIVSGGGTNAVVLNANAGTTVAGAVVYPTNETVNPLKVTDCEFDVVRSGIEFAANVSGQIVVSNTEAYQCVRGFIRNTSVGNVDTQIRGGNVIGCGNQFNGQANYRRAVYQDDGVAAKGSLTLQGVTFAPIVGGYGGPVWFQGASFSMTDCDLTDCDTNDLQKFVLAIGKNYKVSDNRLTSNALNSYATARMISFSNATGPTSWVVNGNVLINNGGSAIPNGISSDFPIQGGVSVDNAFVGAGGFSTQYDINITNLRNQLVPNIGYGPSQKIGTAAPTGGTYGVGDVVWNSGLTNVAGQPVGFVCVVAGTPGTWRSFGVTV